jgi:hypothetical protein
MPVGKRADKWFSLDPYRECLNQFHRRRTSICKNEDLAVMEQLFAELLVQFRGLWEMQNEHKCSLRFRKFIFKHQARYII